MLGKNAQRDLQIGDVVPPLSVQNVMQEGGVVCTMHMLGLESEEELSWMEEVEETLFCDEEEREDGEDEEEEALLLCEEEGEEEETREDEENEKDEREEKREEEDVEAGEDDESEEERVDEDEASDDEDRDEEDVPPHKGLERSMTEIVLSPLFTTYPFVPERAIFCGNSPTGIVAVTVFVARSMTETVPELDAFTTYAFVGERAMPVGSPPTGIVAVTVFVARSMTETEAP